MGRNPNIPVQIYQDRIAGNRFQAGFNYIATSVDSFIFYAHRACTLKAVHCIPSVAGTDAGTVTATIKRCQGTEATTAGDDLLGTTKIDLKGTVNTVQSPALTGTTANLSLAAGDRLSVDFTGTLTSAVGLIQVEVCYD